MVKVFFKVVLSVFLFNMLAGCSNKSYPVGNYQPKPIIVDGDLKEWDEPLRFSSSSGQVQYNITNDNEHIYVSLETHDEATVFKILHAGINLYFDPDGGQSKKINLSFPLANPTPVMQDKSKNTGDARQTKDELRQLLLLEAISYSTTGFKIMENRMYDVSDKSRIQVAIKSGINNSLGYEASIPLQYIYGNEWPGKKSGQNLSVGVVINALKNTGADYQYHNNSTGHNTGMHGGSHGGGGGSYHGNNANEKQGGKDFGTQTPDRTAIFKEDANWYKFKLAVKKQH